MSPRCYRDLPSTPFMGLRESEGWSAGDREGGSEAQSGEHWLDLKLLAGSDLSLIHPAKTCRALTSTWSVPSLETRPRTRRTNTSTPWSR